MGRWDEVCGDQRRVTPWIYEVPMGTKYSELILSIRRGIWVGRRCYRSRPRTPRLGICLRRWRSYRWIGTRSRRRFDGGSGAIDGMRRGAVHAGYGAECGAIFSQRILRKLFLPRGSQKMTDMLTAWTQGKSGAGDLQLAGRTVAAMKMTSIGLGQCARANCLGMKHFPDLVREHVEQRRCSRGGWGVLWLRSKLPISHDHRRFSPWRAAGTRCSMRHG